MFPSKTQLSSLDGYQERFMWSKKCCHVSDVLVCIVFHLGAAEQSSETLVFKCLYPAFCVRVKRSGHAAVLLKIYTKKELVEPVLGGETDGVSCPQHVLFGPIFHSHGNSNLDHSWSGLPPST
ncbi:hypothetical protein DPMN_171199 [Dreissena polymorpha]|uniref:Uncharacterized protein n=1 Tax=Dreissena polymorpha TaxID=45954 RepID=A0A9D4DZA6_DREPO|nr:hypothetical protein DPMN_171199 [Dreissena polymorpha]